MTKRQLIDQIVMLNRTALPSFLAQFDDDNLNRYLAHLVEARKPRIAGANGRRFDRYFAAQRAEADDAPTPQFVAQAQDHIVTMPQREIAGQYIASSGVVSAAPTQALFPMAADEDVLAAADIGGAFERQAQELQSQEEVVAQADAPQPAEAPQCAPVAEPAACEQIEHAIVSSLQDQSDAADEQGAYESQTQEPESLPVSGYAYSYSPVQGQDDFEDDTQELDETEEPTEDLDHAEGLTIQDQPQPVSVGVSQAPADSKDTFDNWLF